MASVLAEIIRSGVWVCPQRSEWQSEEAWAIHLFTLMERSEWNMADVVIAASHQRKERFLTLMLQSRLAGGGALKTNNHTGQLGSGRRTDERQGEEEGRIDPGLSSSLSTPILHLSLFLSFFVQCVIHLSPWLSEAIPAPTQPLYVHVYD